MASKNILIIEKDDDLLKKMKLALEEEGHTVQTLSLEKESSIGEGFQTGSFGVVVLNWEPEKGDGQDLLKKVRNKFGPQVQICLVSRGAEDEQVLEGLRSGADQYLSKPFSMEIFLVKIAKLLQRAEEKINGS